MLESGREQPSSGVGPSHNPEVAGSNPAPAMSVTTTPEPSSWRAFAFSKASMPFVPRFSFARKADARAALGSAQSEVSLPLSAATWAGLMPIDSAVLCSLNQARRA